MNWTPEDFEARKDECLRVLKDHKNWDKVSIFKYAQGADALVLQEIQGRKIVILFSSRKGKKSKILVEIKQIFDSFTLCNHLCFVISMIKNKVFFRIFSIQISSIYLLTLCEMYFRP